MFHYILVISHSLINHQYSSFICIYIRNQGLVIHNVYGCELYLVVYTDCDCTQIFLQPGCTVVGNIQEIVWL